MNTAVNWNKEDMLNKVPQLTIYFWIIKIMATTVGETVADLLSVSDHPAKTPLLLSPSTSEHKANRSISSTGQFNG